ncbi:MAG: DNA primase, partial [Pseudomonadota bacterium]|nr:DNA primase [Pseudomonadota bacterium]
TGLLDSLWASKAADYHLDNPRTQAGAKAAFWQDMRGLVRSITHHQTRSAWADDLERRITAMRGVTRAGGSNRPGQMTAVPLMRRPKTGRHVQIKAVLALLIHTPALFSDYAEALAMLDFNDDGLDALKNALIDRLMNAPDLDAAALRHHLTTEGYAELLSQLFGMDMSARLGGLLGTIDTGEVNDARVRAVLDEMMVRLARNNRRGL